VAAFRVRAGREKEMKNADVGDTVRGSMLEPSTRTPPLSRIRTMAALVIASASAACTGVPPAAIAPPVQVPAAAEKPAAKAPTTNVLWTYYLKDAVLPTAGSLATNAAGDLIFAGDAGPGTLLFRFDPEGHFLWRAPISGGSLGDFALDSAGNTLVTGSFDESVTLNNQLVSDLGHPSVFVAKLAADGKRVWAKIFTGNDVESPSLAVTSANDVLLAGGFDSDLVIGTHVLRGGPDRTEFLRRNLFVARLDPAGGVGWAREFSGHGYVSGIELDSTGQIFLAGDFWDGITFDPATPLRIEKPQADGRDSFFAKLDATGQPRWTRHLGARQVVASPDGSGDTYICGGPWGKWGPHALIKVAADGRVVFRLELDKKVDMVNCTSIAVDAKGTVYVSGEREAAPADPDDDGTLLAGRILKVDGTGNVVSSFSLPHDFTTMNAPYIVCGANGRLLAAGISGTFKGQKFFLAEITL
jgi:hypothetical protein